MSVDTVFELLIIGHIICGAPGLLMFWVPVSTGKGSARHKFWGRTFVWMMLCTASFAVAMSSLSIAYPMTTHHDLLTHPEFSDPALVRGIFGWMMLYLAILTINLAWYGRVCILYRNDHSAHRRPVNMALQVILFVASANCAIQGVMIGQPMMIGISMVGFATVGTNLWFMLRTRTGPLEWLTEHIKALVGTGISVYTAFFAFGAVRLMPELALAPILWAMPLTTGLALIIYHQRKVTRPLRRRVAAG